MLGPDGSEPSLVPLPDRAPFLSIGNYNDFDDYNGYTRIVDTPLIQGFVVTDSVFYVSATDFDTPLYYPSYVKKLVVTVQHPQFLAHPLQFSTLMTY